jgi:hypothetical protein
MFTPSGCLHKPNHTTREKLTSHSPTLLLLLLLLLLFWLNPMLLLLLLLPLLLVLLLLLLLLLPLLAIHTSLPPLRVCGCCG